MFGRIKEIWKETRGNVLEQQFTDALQKLQSADPRVQEEFRIAAKALHGKVSERLYNMSPEGQVKLGKALQSQARENFDFEAGKAHAEWMVGTWLECGQLPGDSAYSVYTFLTRFLTEMGSLTFSPSPTSTSAVEPIPNQNSDMDLIEDIEHLDKLFADEETFDGHTATCQFGWDAADPIIVSSIPEAYQYLSRLQSEDGAPIQFQRIGSLGTTKSGNPIDEYRIFTDRGNALGSLYVSCYGASTTTKCPAGLKLVD